MARKTLMVQDKTSSADVSRHEQYFGPRHGEPQSRLRTCSVASLWRNDNVMNYIVAPAATNWSFWPNSILHGPKTCRHRVETGHTCIGYWTGVCNEYYSMRNRRWKNKHHGLECYIMSSRIEHGFVQLHNCYNTSFTLFWLHAAQRMCKRQIICKLF